MRTRLPILLALAAAASALVAAAPGGATPEAHRRPMKCAARFVAPHFNHYPALRRTMVPRDPERFRVCRYHGLNARKPQLLAGSALVRPGQRLHRVVRTYDKLPEAGVVPVACPADFGREMTIDFRYRHHPDAFVLQALSGCRYGTNGHRSVRMNRRGEKMLHLLERITAN